MKIIKYLLFTVVAIALWITAPLWFPNSTYTQRSTDVSEIDTFVTEQEAERKKLLKAQDVELANLEDKFGKKASVIPTLKKYWAQKFSKEDQFEWLRCERVTAGEEGWRAVCSYRVKGNLRHDTYIVNNGSVTF